MGSSDQDRVREPNAAYSPAGAVTESRFMEMGEGRRELVRGEVIELTPAGGTHGEIAMALAVRLHAYVHTRGLGVVYAAETGFVLERDPDTVRAPDVAFVAAEHVIDTDKFIPLAPDLAVEVISPSDRASYVAEKVECWLRNGTRQVWVVDPARRTVEVHVPSAPKTIFESSACLVGGDVLPGFSLELRELFPPPNR